jgi:hypothetical protein
MRPDDVLTTGIPADPAALAGAAPRPAETWLRIVQVHDRITHRVDSALHHEHDLSLTGFEALRRIAEAPGERATMGEVAEALGLSRAGVTSTGGGGGGGGRGRPPAPPPPPPPPPPRPRRRRHPRRARGAPAHAAG